MDQFNIGNFGNNFNKMPINNKNISNNPPPAPIGGQPIPMPNPKMIAPQLLNRGFFASDLRMNALANLDRSLYMKELMNLPKDLQDVLVLIQNNATKTAQETSKLLNSNINISTLAQLLQLNGKEAMNKLVLIMSNAAKQGINDTSQIKDAIKLINASISASENPNQILKSFMLLYLPWLPLQEGVDFELEIESSDASGDDSETTITIMITTRNFGNVKVTLILSKSNQINIIINCSEKFPKEELLKRLNAESKSHSIQSTIIFDEKKDKSENIKNDIQKEHQTKINMSNAKEVNPFLLLMANAVIRQTIDIDNQSG